MNGAVTTCSGGCGRGGGVYAQNTLGLEDSASLKISNATADEGGAIWTSALTASDSTHIEIVDAQTKKNDSHDIYADITQSTVNRKCEFCMGSTKSECACKSNGAASGFSQCCHASHNTLLFTI